MNSAEQKPTNMFDVSVSESHQTWCHRSPERQHGFTQSLLLPKSTRPMVSLSYFFSSCYSCRNSWGHLVEFYNRCILPLFVCSVSTEYLRQGGKKPQTQSPEHMCLLCNLMAKCWGPSSDFPKRSLPYSDRISESNPSRAAVSPAWMR